MATKKCEACDQEIGESEKVCPKCGVDYEELEDTIKGLSVAETVREKRKKAETAAKLCAKCGKDKHEGACVTAPAKKKNKLAGLGSVFGRKK